MIITEQSRLQQAWVDNTGLYYSRTHQSIELKETTCISSKTKIIVRTRHNTPERTTVQSIRSQRTKSSVDYMTFLHTGICHTQLHKVKVLLCHHATRSTPNYYASGVHYNGVENTTLDATLPYQHFSRADHIRLH